MISGIGEMMVMMINHRIWGVACFQTNLNVHRMIDHDI